MEFSPSKRGFRAILFDVDGTLVDTIPMIVAGLGDAFEKYTGNRMSDAELKSMIGTPLTAQMNLFGMDQWEEPSLDERVRFTMDRYVAHSDRIIRLHAAERAYQACIDAGMPTALVTSRNRAELDWFLGKFPTLDQSSVTVSASDVEKPKPDAEPALKACAMLGIDPTDACFIGDSTHDMECAHAAGLTAVAVSYGGASHQDLANTMPHVLLETPEALESWINDTLFRSESCYLTERNLSSQAPTDPRQTPANR